ncbi:CRE-FEH-1 protein [Caenorhabditis remanei]|uniref:CRE-FEH-1 protein n=1 Tax=Caenorhabditis remanei TaxID=31234 RepID=E3LRS8_CAERE|nr:CRE-FEH-1 protein [Caenorhabditis remanei]
MREGTPRVRIEVNKRPTHFVSESEEQRLQRVHSRDSDTATMNFVTDDRMQEEHEEYSAFKEAYEEEESREYVIENGVKRLVNQHYDSRGYSSAGRGQKGRREEERRRNMAVDYSSQDFRQSLAAIDQASRDGAISRGEDGVRVRQIGDTTIMTEHRDPYSFYWQLDQQRREAESPPRRAPPTDYVIDEEEEVLDTVLSPETDDSGVMFENQYRRPVRHPLPPPPPIMEEEPKDLPPGWEKHQDPQGYSYYWHVDSGTIQRQPPPPVRDVTPARSPSPPPPPPVYSVTTASRETQADAPPPQIIQLPPQQPVIEEHAFKQTTTKRRIEQDEMSEGYAEENQIENGDSYHKPVRFAVRSMGWIEISEDELTAEKSSRAVNSCIVELTNRTDIDNIPKWGDGRELIMELDDNELALIDPDSMNVIHAERIQSIRVWGVGRDNGRDFAYVSRDRGTRRFMCHVFRCDTSAKTIANTLRDICKRLMLHRRPSSLHAIESGEKRIVRSEGLSAPIDEPRKVLRCHFLGVTQVPKATGIEILNEAVDRLVSQVRPERWIFADVSIAPSTIAIVEVNGGQIAECRVRYLSFLGIGKDVKHCAFIMQTSNESFMCYVFHVEPSAATMAKMIEAACKLRYQKVLDAHSSSRHHSGMSNHGPLPPPSSYHGKGWTETFRDAFGSVTSRMVPSRSTQRL